VKVAGAVPAYESGAEWHVLSVLLSERLGFSFWIVQVLIGSLLPFVLLLVSMRPRTNETLAKTLSGLASVLILMQVFAMRWNVVVGGQLFSKSFRGFVDFPLEIYGREGIIAAGIVLALPLMALWVANRLLPL